MVIAEDNNAAPVSGYFIYFVTKSVLTSLVIKEADVISILAISWLDPSF